MLQDIVFRGLSAPLRLEGAGEVAGLLSEVASGWPHDIRKADPAAAPFFSIRSEPDSPWLRCESHVEPKPPRRLDPLNAICDALAALALALPAEDAQLLCLHAAGVAIAGRLIVFPNVRRAGKSTLSVALARAGHAVWGDDVLPLSFTQGAGATGHAMGISPRLRLPLPPALSSSFRDWVGSRPGPQNRQYRYLTLPGLPGHGAPLPVAAFVLLDRQDKPCPPRLAPVTPDTAMDALLHQNFTRDRHSADILSVMAATLTDRPVYRLGYWDLESAVACLEAAVSDLPQPQQRATDSPATGFRLADFSSPAAGVPRQDCVLRQRKGSSARRIGATLYLADAEGRAIHRMDPLAAAIWALLEDPITTDDIKVLLTEAFPEVGPDRIAADLHRLLNHFSAAGLTETAT